MDKALVLEVERCTGCESCVAACSFAHARSFSPKARIQVERVVELGLSVPIFCQQCAHAPCVTVCPSGALRRECGAAVLDEGACIGCRMCLAACPFGAIRYGAEGRAEKCDLCGGDPLCARVCTPGALSYRELEAPAEARRREAARRQLMALEAQLG